MLILGIDPGTATTGYGLVKIISEDEFDAIEWGLIETDKNGSPGARLSKIYEQLSDIFKKHSPDIMAIEKIFFARNVKTAIRVGQAQGVMLHCAASYKTEAVEYAPGTIKKVVAGNGRAGKKVVQKSIRKFLGAGVRSKPGKKTHFDNAADALAVALCHAHTIKEEEKGGKRG